MTENSRQELLNLFISCLYLPAEVFIKAMKVFSNFLFAASKVKAALSIRQHFDLTIVISSSSSYFIRVILWTEVTTV